VTVEGREVMKGTTTTLSCMMDAPFEASSDFYVKWTGNGMTWNSLEHKNIDHYTISAGGLQNKTVQRHPLRKMQISTLEIRSQATNNDVTFTCAVNSTKFGFVNADNNYILELGVYGKFRSFVHQLL
jgi:hypothetical protein